VYNTAAAVDGGISLLVVFTVVGIGLVAVAATVLILVIRRCAPSVGNIYPFFARRHLCLGYMHLSKVLLRQ
jgi:hypothetical protein